MSLSKSSLQVILAKSGNNECDYLPLWVHATDVAMVMEDFLNERFKLSEICGIDDELLIKLGKLLGYLHDIGKITPLFQAKILDSIPEYRSILEGRGLEVSESSQYLNKEKSHHSICGESILLSLGFPTELSSIVGIHHGSYRSEERPKKHINAYPETYFSKKRDKDLWGKLYKDWADYSLEKSGFSCIAEIPRLNKKTMVLLSGLLIMCDWIASDQIKFPLFDENYHFFEGNYPPRRCEDALDKLALPEGWMPEYLNFTDSDFDDLFGFSMNSVQRAIINAAASADAPGVYILEAPMGVGKTEAALAVAEILANKCGKTGLFFGLPTQATANGIFERVVNWAEAQSNDFFRSINLAHGKAEFQPKFAEMSGSIPCVDSHEDDDGRLIVHSFFCGNKPSLLADFVVGTVDRLLIAVLKKKHAMLLHLGLSQKVVIIDECHAYDAYMNKYLDRALTWLHEYNVPVILLSATLPPDRRLALVNAYLHGKDEKSELKESDLPITEYPRLTYANGEQVNAISIPIETTRKEVKIVRANDECVIEEICHAVENGACVGVICNTVLRAQNFASAARAIDGANVILYHAQFTILDRIKREETLKKAVGKQSTTAERAGTIIIGTQVLEQSLDIDFDIMITDLCPMDLLLQRIGRLHRHPRNRPNGYETVKCIVLGTEELADASKNIYTEWLLLQTLKNLPDVIALPDDIDRLVCETYKSDDPSADEVKAFEEYRFMLAEKQQKANGFLMSVPRDSKYGNNLHNWLSGSISDSDTKAQAAVRDGISSIEVILMVRCRDGHLKCLYDDEQYSPYECPSDEKCRYIAQQKLRLPSRFCREYNIDKTIAELEKACLHLSGFQHSHWLKGELFLLLDESLTAHLGGCIITYSEENGLEYEKEE